MKTDTSIGVTVEQKQRFHQIKDDLSRKYPVKVKLRDVVEILLRDHEELESIRREGGAKKPLI